MSGENSVLRITEIFYSLQGESTQTGRPCGFVRLTGCNLRCVWCDTAYAFEGGADLSVREILGRIDSFGVPLVLITGGEPLAQPAVHDLMAALLVRGQEVMIETGGSLDIAGIDPRVRIVMDLKCPGSGMESRNRWENLAHLKPSDEIKFVINDRRDYEWAREAMARWGLAERAVLLFSPVFGALPPRRLAEWILADHLPVRMQLQLHKLLWSPDARGV